jgi:hypothetical protein
MYKGVRKNIIEVKIQGDIVVRDILVRDILVRDILVRDLVKN